MPLSGPYEPSSWPDARNQVERYETSGGTEANTFSGYPVVVLTMMGKVSGKVRKTPLIRVERDGTYALVASMGGAPMNPSWYHNIKAAPLVELQDGPVRRDYRARELDGQERQSWWELAVETYPDYEAYQLSTQRRIPVLLAEPVDR